MAALSPDSRARAAQARRAAIEAGSRFRRDFADADNWQKLAQERGIRLPAWWVAPSPTALKKWFRKLRAGEVFTHVYGDKMTSARLIALNPDMPLRAFVGQMLERACK